MHNYPPFEMRDEDQLVAFIEKRRFANMVVNGETGLLVAHVPLLLRQGEEGLVLEGHVARSNEFGRALDGKSGIAIFNGPDAYVSAGFYPSKQLHGKVAPTWNYMAVHATGPMEGFSCAAQLSEHLVHLTEVLEANEPMPWSVGDAPAGFTDALVKRLVGFRMRVEKLEGISKLNQNSTEADRRGVIEGLTVRNDAREQPVVEQMLSNERNRGQPI